jgi:hypothetical protein
MYSESPAVKPLPDTVTVVPFVKPVAGLTVIDCAVPKVIVVKETNSTGW